LALEVRLVGAGAGGVAVDSTPADPFDLWVWRSEAITPVPSLTPKERWLWRRTIA